MAAYTTWAKVLELYPPADDVEPTSGDQTQLIADMSDLFQGYIRGIHKDDLTTVDSIVNRTVALLCINELRGRRATGSGEREFVEFPHFGGDLFAQGREAHGYIASIRSGAFVLQQDVAGHDVTHPEVIPASGNSGAGTVEAHLPHEWKDNRSARITIKVTTAGRVDDEDMRYSWYRDNSATESGSDATPSADWVHLEHELYLRFKDPAQTGESFAANDVYTLDVYPPDTAAQSTGPTEIATYLG